MKRLLYITICLVAAIMFAVSCGGNSNKQLKDGDMDQATEKMVKEASKGKDFTKAGKEKLASLGKTEKDKRVVARSDWPKDNKVEIFVVVPDDMGGWYSEVYHFFYDTEDGKKNYNYKTYAEKNDDAGLWILTKLSQSYSSWQEAYDKYKDNGDTIIE